MRIGGAAFTAKNRIEVRVQRPNPEDPDSPLVWPLTVVGLPFGWRERMVAIGVLERPKPPVEYAKHPKSGKYLKGEDGFALKERLTDDVEYVRATNKFVRRVEALTLAEHLRDETTVEFDAKRPETDKKEEWIAYADALLAELAASGFTDDEIGMILSKGDEASRGIDLRESAADFLGEQ